MNKYFFYFENTRFVKFFYRGLYTFSLVPFFGNLTDAYLLYRAKKEGNEVAMGIHGASLAAGKKYFKKKLININ